MCPVRLPTGDTALLVTRHADNRALLADERFSRAAAARVGAPRARRIPLDSAAITTLDGADHARLRSAVARAFTNRRVRALRPSIEKRALELADALAEAGPPGDLVGDFARPFALDVVAGLLGIAVPDFPAFRRLTDAYLSVDGHTPEQIRKAVLSLKGMLAELVAARRAEPADDVIGVLVEKSADGSAELSDAEIVTFGVTLLVAGYETVAALVANVAVVLLRHPEQLRLLGERGGLHASAVEELLRYTAISPAGGTLRVAVEDMELGGSTIRAGQAVQPSTVAANRDPRVFAAPDTLDLERPDNPHLAFGHGVHHCLGANLARAELKAAFDALLTRLPGFRAAVPLDDLAWDNHKIIRGPAALPLTW
ncbi:cytochrome P450 [Streptomyces acidicola]|uniref:cytochrome P450 n=1 Tax=Streptomyces acidicola TaxID=2596892 RepID=UPI00381483FF